jgi:hypothetical protein
MNVFKHTSTRLALALTLCGACELPMAMAGEPAPMPAVVAAPAAVVENAAGVVRIRKERTVSATPAMTPTSQVAPVGFRDALEEGMERFETPAQPVTMSQPVYNAQPVAYGGQGYSETYPVQAYPADTVYSDCPNGECDRHGNCKSRCHQWLKYKFGYFIPTGNGGTGTPLFGKYARVYPQDPSYFDQRDGQLYSAQGYGVPVAVPLAPVVGHQYNYGWGIPSSRLTPISHPAN